MPPGIVSIRYFSAVGELRSTKSIPDGSLCLRVGAASIGATSTSAIVVLSISDLAIAVHSPEYLQGNQSPFKNLPCKMRLTLPESLYRCNANLPFIVMKLKKSFQKMHW